jgi:S1-C subfamily serine protease
MRIYLVAALYGVMLLSASTIPAAGLAESKFPSLKTLKQTNVALEMIGFGFGSGLQPNSNGEPNGNGFDILSQKWVGSGFIVSNDGSVITNYHVARRALYGLAKFEDGSSYNISEIRAYSPYDDLAILKISAIENFKKVRLGNSDDVQPLDNVLAVGNPHGQGINISEGQISQIIQNEKAHVTLIVHTAPITSGNSGGALYKENRVIAVNASVMLAPYGGGTGFNHAIPINRVKDLLEKYGDQSIPLSRAFSVDKSIIIKTKFEEISAANGSVPAADGEIPGVYPYDFTLSQLEDYLIIINSPGRDLALIVTDSQDMIGFGDIREVDFEGVILANSLTRNIRINVINYDPQPANFGIHVGCIIW